jgi:prolyl oligopeptidase
MQKLLTHSNVLRDDTVETLHGRVVVDPYRWLENSDDPEVACWTHAQNQASVGFLQTLPGRARIEARLAGLFRIEEVQEAQVRGGRIFTLRREGGSPQPTLFARDGIDGDDRPLLDLSTEDETGLLGLDWWHPSRDGAKLAYGVSQGGDEWSTLRVRDVETGRDLGESIPRARSASISWFPDGTGFYYTRYPAPGDVPLGQENYFRRVYRHVLGTPHEDDPLIWGEGRPAADLPNVVLDADGRWLVVSVDHGWAHTDIFVMDLDRPDCGFRYITPPGTSAHEIGCAERSTYRLSAAIRSGRVDGRDRRAR